MGWDITTLPPKSFSILSAFSNDPALEKAFKDSNRQMMEEAERLILAQANTQYGRFFEQTGNACWAEFHHKIGRPVEHDRNGKKVFAGQPLEHIHNFLISATYSKGRDKVLAIDPFLIYKSAPYLQSYFHTVLNNKVAELGYQVERTQDAWEVVGVSHLNERFSERSKIIDRIAKEKGITTDQEKSKLGALSRVSKSKSVPENELYDLWKSQLSKEEFDALQNLKGLSKRTSNAISPKEAIDRSLEHFLQRASIAETNRVLGKAMEISYGSGHSPADFEKELKSREDILYSEEHGVPILSTRQMVRMEERMITMAVSGKGKFKALNPEYKIKREFLNEDQRKAIREALSTQDQFFAIEGKAGSGKSTLLQELSDGLKAVSRNIVPIAPSSQAVEVLRKEGFEDAQTIASFLINPKLQENIQDGVLCVDEASMIGIPTMSKILTISKERNARTIMAGNIRQHSSPGEYGDALRILQQSGLKTVHVQQNMRQKPADYKKAVDLISQKKLLQGYQILDKQMKAVHEIPEYEDRLNKISDDYINSVKAKRSALIVSPTHAEGDKITEIVREKLKKAGLIRGKEKSFDTLKDLSLTDSQKKDVISYQEGHVIRFIKNQKAVDNKAGFKAGSHYEVLPPGKKDEVKVRDLKTKQVLTLPHQSPEHYSVFRKDKMNIAVGDLIRPTVNLKSKEGTKVNNGTPQVVKGFSNGHIQLENGKTLARDSYHIAHNHVNTSHAAQGRSCQDVYVSMSDASFGAVNDQAFYVAVSRGRTRINLYTSSKQELKSAIQRSGERTTATQVAEAHKRRLLEQKQRRDYQNRIKTIEDHAVSRQRHKETTRDISGRIQKTR
ncbi:AAA family ATPase [Reichenbachiella sp. MALMAid0571]|uniref:AAA family ATPase n=1 Tax=Reichenbachiella sp. MALMAid0571 TaxID=3143939 RepID=UPI0032E01D0B